MVNIQQLMGLDLLADMIDRGYIKERRHPTLPLRILNYSDSAQYERVWNDATLQCRGLVVDDAGTVVARPFRKFFNDTEHRSEHLPDLDLDAPVEVTDKMDGSLGILFEYDGQPIVATRGSFESAQAEWATAFFRREYADTFRVAPGTTVLVEIVYPENRIVVSYGWSDLVLLGQVDNDTGQFNSGTIFHDWPGRTIRTWPGRIVDAFAYTTLREALAAPPRDNAEGFVIRYVETGQMVKIKLDEYIRLHRIVTGLSKKVVWEHAAAGRPFEELIADLPDEFHRWVADVWDDLQARYDSTCIEADKAYEKISRSVGLPRSDARKEFALAIADLPDSMKNLLFPWHQIDQEIWKQLKPEGDTRMHNGQEEAA
ncbi:RNA ligase [Nocardia sp. NPDC004860]|uniref:RNA ligase n=1 Tax=Nocardia sp. NPDC004860 TaxID=3154557 RepID=UPI0033B284CE